MAKLNLKKYSSIANSQISIFLNKYTDAAWMLLHIYGQFIWGN